MTGENEKNRIYGILYSNLERNDRYTFARKYVIELEWGQLPFFPTEYLYSIYDSESHEIISSDLSEEELIQECKELIFSKRSILSGFRYDK